jgi:putative protease
LVLQEARTCINRRFFKSVLCSLCAKPERLVILLKKPELLAPAGDFESLKMAINFGADAVYIGGKDFSMRASPANFSLTQLVLAGELAHKNGVKLYLACNILPRNEELASLPAFFENARQAGIDGLIISDLGVLELARRHAPEVEIHISTQAGVVNFGAANAFFSLGAKRVVLARELSLREIEVIRQNTPDGLAIEAFVHGAMCVSFSGRCLLSEYLTGRDANRGECAQPCRWNYTLMEQKRSGEYFPVFEDEQGTHILNAKDLCMLPYIPELVKSGITSLKIEGRAKSAYYTAVVTNAYRMAIDAYFEQDEHYSFDKRLLDEVEKVSHRDYCTGFYFGPLQKGQIYGEDSYLRSYDIIAVVEDCKTDLAICRQRNPFSACDAVEALIPGSLGQPVIIEKIYDENGKNLDCAPHPDMKVLLKTDIPLLPGTILRKAVVKNCINK